MLSLNFGYVKNQYFLWLQFSCGSGQHFLHYF